MLSAIVFSFCVGMFALGAMKDWDLTNDTPPLDCAVPTVEAIHYPGQEGEEWLSWTTAIGIDAGLVGLELSTLASHQLVVFQRVKGLCRTGIVATLILSAGLNVMGFWQGAETDQGRVIAVILGCFVPGMVYALIQVANAQQTSSRVPSQGQNQETHQIQY